MAMFDRMKRAGDDDPGGRRTSTTDREGDPGGGRSGRFEAEGREADRYDSREPIRDDRDSGSTGAVPRSRDRAEERTRVDHDRDQDRRGRDTEAGLLPDRDRQKEKFGGFNWGAAFFGWLVAVGISVLLLGLLSAAGAVFGLSTAGNAATQAQQNAETIGIVGGILLLVTLAIAYYCGGYVAGRMSRFDGARQGIGVWVIALLITIILAIAGAVLGAEYNVLAQFNLPALPVEGQSLTTGGIIALLAVLATTLIAAILGGIAGRRYHKKVDRAGFGE